ncbi:MAG: hypothetical protein EPO22_10970 [Dehalococcoidia bacterium]|nr:MAG: hypothetical protein EPO22_10970 [Dehalococcoidia bacterium]
MADTKLSAAARAFLAGNRQAAMTTLRRNGTPHTLRIGVSLVDGKIWSSGTRDRVRTRYLRRDPRSTLFVFDTEWRWLALECHVRILDGRDAPELNLRLFQEMQRGQAPAGRIAWFGTEHTTDEFLQIMRDERRLIYEFNVDRVYGVYDGAQ